MRTVLEFNIDSPHSLITYFLHRDKASSIYQLSSVHSERLDWTVSLIYSRSYFLIIPIFSQIGIGEATFQLFNKSIIYYSFTHVIRYFQLTENTELQTNTHLTFSYFIVNHFNLFLSINIVLHKIFYDVHKQYKR